MYAEVMHGHTGFYIAYVYKELNTDTSSAINTFIHIYVRYDTLK